MWAANSNAQGGSANAPPEDTTAVAPSIVNPAVTAVAPPNTVTANPAVTTVAPLNTVTASPAVATVAPPGTVTVNPAVSSLPPHAVAPQQTNLATPATATGSPSQATSLPQAAVSSGTASSLQTLAALAAASPSASPPVNLFDPTLIPRIPQTPVVPSIEPELSPMSKFMVATEQSLYKWQDDSDLVLPQFNPYDELHPATHWSHPATPAFAPTVYQNMQGVNPATAANYPPAFIPNVSGHVTFSSTIAHPSHATDLASNVTPGTNPNVPAAAGVFATSGMANGAAAQLAQGPVLNIATNLNSIPAEMGSGHVEEASKNRPKKRKSYEEESAQLILPDGSRRRHKPRHVDENYVLSTTVGKKGRGAKKARKE